MNKELDGTYCNCDICKGGLQKCMNKEYVKIAKLVKNINKEFRKPFIQTSVRAKFTDSGFTLQIGRRDVQFDKDFNVIGAGTSGDCEEV